MYLIILVCVVAFLIIYCIKNHIFIEFNTFFKSGFELLKNKFGLYLYTGKQGTGKTYSAVKFIDKLNKQMDCIIFSNILSFSKSYSNCTYQRDIFKIIQNIELLEKCGNKRQIIVFFDEIFTVCEKSGSLAPQILSFLSQLRKRNIIFVSTAQEWAEINITFRRYCRFQISCKMISFFNHAFVINSINDGDGIVWDKDLQEFIAPLLQTNISKGLRRIIDLYDTYETISLTRGINKSSSNVRDSQSRTR